MIKFPKMHIAASVQNRILNVRDELLSERRAEAPERITPPPSVPDAQPQSVGIEEALAGETPGAAMPPLEPGADSAAAAGSVLEGGTALEGLLRRRMEQQ